MNKVERAANRFRRSMSAAAAKPLRVPRVVPVLPSVPPALFCYACDAPIELGREVVLFDASEDWLRILCYGCKDFVEDDGDWDDDEEWAVALRVATQRGGSAP